ncbi:MAG: hypothetical protein IJB00_01460 [Akkermansia sp.]|nr:hypothetical protein [Akkermansia sp.]
MKKRRFSHLCILFLLLLSGAGVIRLWFYIEEQLQPILVPVNQAYSGYSNLPKKVLGLQLDSFVFKGWDGGDVQAVIVSKEGEESSRQLTVMSDLSDHPVEKLEVIDYVLVCVDWDHGIRSALPLAESLTAAGLKCVLWDPRGVNDRRPYCTHGLKESRDVPLLIDAIEKRHPKGKPVVVAVGQGYGAGLLLHAAAHDTRIQGLAAIDAYASLRQSVKRTLPDSFLSPVMLEMMNLRMERTLGMECFEVAPVEQASFIHRDVPVLVVHLAQDNPVCTLGDALTIYHRLRSDKREVWAMMTEPTLPGLTSRQKEILPAVKQLPDEETAMTSLVHWLDGPVADSILSPHIDDPSRPVPTSDLHL